MTRPTLHIGSTGPHVKELQQILGRLDYYSGPINGIFETMTEQSVMDFQHASGIAANGVVDSLTWAALNEPSGSMPPAESAPSASSRPTLRRGSTGPFVTQLQQKLTLLRYYRGPISGIFGAETEHAVILFQQALGLETDGIVGPITWAAIDAAIEDMPVAPVRPTLRLGSTGIFVTELKQMLSILGYFSGSLNAIFDEETEQAVKAFQHDAGLVVDGIVGPLTWSALDEALDTLPPAERPVLRLGSTGYFVTKLQHYLILLGYYSGPENGIFDAKTEAAVKAFQLTAGIVEDGIVGFETWTALDEAIEALPPKPVRPTLRRGDTGPYVTQLQQMLSLLGFYTGPINGIFDAETEQAVIAFQRVSRLVADGIVGPQTWAALDEAIEDLPILTPERPVIRKGDTGQYVQVLQMMLRLLGYYHGPINAVFDENTRQAVIKFQRENNLTADGVVGPDTWAALDAAISSLPPGTSGRPTLRPGTTGRFVRELKEILTTLGYYNGPIDQVFDALTQQAVIAFQMDHGLVADGIVGPETWSALDAALAEMPPVNPRPVLSEGSMGPAVVGLHEMLRFLGFFTAVPNNYFGPITRAAVEAFQRDAGLVADGIVGPQTWAALDEVIEHFNDRFPILRLGSTGPAVARLQRFLNAAGFYSGPFNAEFSESTRDAVIDFQSAYGLSVDGVVGPLTWRRLERAVEQQNEPEFALSWVQNPAAFAVTTDAFKIISPVWYLLNENSSGQSFIDPRRASADFTRAAHARGVRVWGTIQSFNAGITRNLVTNPDNIRRFIAEMSAFIVEHELDGFCIDFEYMYVADKARFSAFVRQVASALRAEAARRNKELLISICFTAPPLPGDTGNMWSASVDRREVGKICDYSAVMLYDEHGPGTAPGPVASIDWVRDNLAKTLLEVRSRKLLLGVPFYSASY